MSSLVHFDPFHIAPSQTGAHAFRTDMFEADHAYVCKVDVPGVPKENCHIEVVDDVLTLTADYAAEKEGEGEHKIHWRERVTGKVTRSMKLPQHVDVKNIAAKHENGLLTITLPKMPKEEEKDVHKVEIL